MSRRLQMLQVARLATRSLGESARLVVSFIRGLALPDGSYANRDGRPDLYYTPFALDVLAALDAMPTDERDPEQARRTRGWLDGFGDGGSLDFVHRCCLARAWASQSPAACPAGRGEAIAARIIDDRADDGGYATQPRLASGTAYGCFLAVNAFADCGLQPLVPADRAAIVACLGRLQSGDGGWSNAPGQPQGSTTATAAAIATLRSLDAPVPREAAEFLLARRHPVGGFTAAPDVPMPDLLSTAVAVHALDAIDAPWRESREQILDFLDSLWSAEGAFHGSWADDHADAEYTFYGLVALGHASV
ncbi:MAG: prenyltransferase/squalene oxidase repeat-containing protein [Planctomycetia bacterium]